ncbi:MAG TPA: hypothetical protein VEQ59_10915 [Polyangiaceae bacterium]|nr:hypothetical protein [Polyangiaceae bacterium]
MLLSARYLSCSCLLLALAGCAGGTETGNPSLTGQLSYSGVSSAPSDIGVRSGGGIANVKNAWFALGQVTVSSAGDCGVTGNRGFSVPALGIGDHAAGVHNRTDFAAAAGAFCTVELPFQPVAAGDATAPEALRGHSVVVEGELADGTVFVLESDLAPLVRLQGGANGFEISDEAPYALLAFDFATWLGGVDWATASLEAGRIRIDAESNTEILRSFESQLASGVALYRDRDGDGVLDAAPVLLARGR